MFGSFYSRIVKCFEVRNYAKWLPYWFELKFEHPKRVLGSHKLLLAGFCHVYAEAFVFDN